MTERFDTVIIGGGQAGLAMGYHLAKRDQSFVILDSEERIGDAWRNRWESLRLFTPVRYSSLPGLAIQAPPWSFLTKDEMADYLADYAAHFDLPVRTDVTVDGLRKEDDRFVVTAAGRRFEADHVVVATGAHRIPKTPAFAAALDPTIVQLHSGEYRDPSQLQDGDVLLVGAGNSGAEIAFELAETRHCVLAGPSTGEIPVRHGSIPARFAFRIVRFLGHRVLTRGTPIGRKVGPKLTAKGTPLIRRKLKDLTAAGVERAPRVIGVQEGRPMLEDGSVLEVANVIWCTGFRTNFGWIDLPVFADDGQPIHNRGIVESEPGLYFVGLVFQYSVSSDVLPGSGRDAGFIAKHIDKHRRVSAPKERALAAA